MTFFNRKYCLMIKGTAAQVKMQYRTTILNINCFEIVAQNFKVHNFVFRNLMFEINYLTVA